MSGKNFVKRFFSGTTITNSHSSGAATRATGRPGARAMLAAGLTSLMLVAGAFSPAWAQDSAPANPGANDTEITQPSDADQSVSPYAMIGGWAALLQENCDSITTPKTTDKSAPDAAAKSWGDGIFETLGQSPLGQALQEYAAQAGMMICRDDEIGMIQWSKIGHATVISSNPEYMAHPMFGQIGDAGAAYAMGVQLRLRQQQDEGLEISTNLHPADALLMNRLVRLDAALYMAEVAVDLKYNHDDPSLYNAVGMMSNFEGHAALSAVLVSALEQQALATQPQHVIPAEGEDAKPTLGGITLDGTIRRAALDIAAGTPQAGAFDGMILSAFETYLQLQPHGRTELATSPKVVAGMLEAIGKRTGDDGHSYLSGGQNLRSEHYLQTNSVNDAKRMANILMRLSGVGAPAQGESTKPKARTYTASQSL